MRNLNDRDKHRSLVSLSAHGQITGDELIQAIVDEAAGNGKVFDPSTGGPIKLGTEIYRAVVSGLPPTNVERAGYIHPVPALLAAPELQIIPAAREMVGTVFKVIGQFERD